MEDHKDIGILIKNRLKYAEKGDSFDFDGEWQAIKPIVQKNNFVTWRLNTFNIYYLIFITTSITLILFYLFFASKPDLAENATKNGRETITIKEGNIANKTSRIDKDLNSNNHSGSNQFNKSGQLTSTVSIEAKDSADKNSIVPVISSFQIADTLTNSQVNSEAQTVQSTPPLQEAKKNKPVITLNKQDTIIKTDTLRKVKTKKIFK
ncbi:MAG: hypothetical protein J7604_23645 [Sporocytophaga sp.]|uniref:hypothetical protein n=1 Tax=Sporocytophaga sp. TaxID=2231183 RepID=UPI001B225F4A|nr:hypothetical protein [Sporocytophaga sp.]MBO9703229.1 hypothetical protein [Sporocytophaga sp.]